MVMVPPPADALPRRPCPWLEPEEPLETPCRSRHVGVKIPKPTVEEPRYVFLSRELGARGRRGSSSGSNGSNVSTQEPPSPPSRGISPPLSPWAQSPVATSPVEGSPRLPASPLTPGCSTLKLANIPRRCSIEELLAAVDEMGFGEAYDFFFLPLGQHSKKNHGCAFINFKSSDLARRFREAIAECPIRTKMLEVTEAPLQGLRENVEHVCQSGVLTSLRSPNVLLRGF